MSKLIGKEKFLKLIEKAIPKHFNDLNTKFIAAAFSKRS